MESKANKNKNLSVVLHVLAWVILIILPQLVIDRYWGSNGFFAWGFYLNAAMYGIIFYINYLWLVPHFYLKDKKVYYYIWAVVFIVIFYFISNYLNKNVIHNPSKQKALSEALEQMVKEKLITRAPMMQLQAYYFALISVIVTGFSLGLRLIEQHEASEKRQKELEREKLNSELAFLKNQISPHFFFNTLNNIYSLIEVNKNNAQEAVLKLSKMMRYLLYESEQGETGLVKEIGFMKHYIDLMKLRLSPKVELSIDLPENPPDYKIPPLLLIPFIENAFKHGISYRDKPFIRISMTAANDQIIFKCINSIGQSSAQALDEAHSGIGLENVKKRLGILFPGSHTLKVEKVESFFSVYLEINLKQKE